MHIFLMRTFLCVENFFLAISSRPQWLFTSKLSSAIIKRNLFRIRRKKSMKISKDIFYFLIIIKWLYLQSNIFLASLSMIFFLSYQIIDFLSFTHIMHFLLFFYVFLFFQTLFELWNFIDDDDAEDIIHPTFKTTHE